MFIWIVINFVCHFQQSLKASPGLSPIRRRPSRNLRVSHLSNTELKIEGNMLLREILEDAEELSDE
jgi:hypothetical protein